MGFRDMVEKEAKHSKKCTKCGKVTDRPHSDSWEYGLCPVCINKSNIIQEIPDVKRVGTVARFNPVDAYLNISTYREMELLDK